MKSIGFIISHKENENRRALLPVDIRTCINHPEALFFEKGYGEVLGIKDDEYLAAGCHMVDRDIALTKDIVCDPKIGDAEYLDKLHAQTIFGWVHAVQNKDIADKIINGTLTAIVWEDMYEDGRHTYYRNNEIAGEAAIMHAFLRHGIFPYGQKVAVLGRGNAAMGAIRALHYLCADVTVYDRRTEKQFQKNLPLYDVIVNAVLWDTKRIDHIINYEDLKRMKAGSMIVDISCDHNGAIESSVPTTIQNPDYMMEGVRHYVVDHTPSLVYKTASMEISVATAPYINDLIEENFNQTLDKATCIRDGIIIDQRIIEYNQLHS